MTIVSHKRAAASNPGKHGDRDWRVTFDGKPPTHSELVFMLGFHLLAEDRYSPGHGRYLLWHFVDLLTHAKTPQRISEIAEDIEETVRDRSGFQVVT